MFHGDLNQKLEGVIVSKISAVSLHQTVLQLNIWWHLNNYVFVYFHQQPQQNA